MILGALAALGVDEKELTEQLKLLNLEGWQMSFERVDRSGINACYAKVSVPQENKHRHLHHIEKIISDSSLQENIKQLAIKIFTRLAQAEARVHGIEVVKVHFHEVGAMDAILDVVGACIGFELLGIEKFACSKLHVGSGFVQMEHGKFPVPPPAVVELLKEKNIPIYSTEITGELLTPTGAAIISTVCEQSGSLPEIEIQKTGYGAGTREYKNFPNVLRLILGVTKNASDNESNGSPRLMGSTTSHLIVEKLMLLETNVDDVSGQTLGFVLEQAFLNGALDCWFTSIQMKKNRPAVKISILCETTERERLLRLLFMESKTLGVRCREVERFALAREIVKVQTEYGEIDLKVAHFEEKVIKASPEYDQCREIALKSGVSLAVVEEAARKAWKSLQTK